MASLDVSMLKQLSAETLCSLLMSIPGEKELVLEPALMRPLDRVAGMSLLKSCGVARVFKLDRAEPPPALRTPGGKTTVFLSRAGIPEAKTIADMVRGAMSALGQRASLPPIHLVCLPKALQSIRILLEEEGLAEIVTPHDYMWQMLPLDSDLLSLEMPEFFKSW